VPGVVQCHGNDGGVLFAFQTFPDVGHVTYQLREAAARPIADFFLTRFSLLHR